MCDSVLSTSLLFWKSSSAYATFTFANNINNAWKDIAKPIKIVAAMCSDLHLQQSSL